MKQVFGSIVGVGASHSFMTRGPLVPSTLVSYLQHRVIQNPQPVIILGIGCILHSGKLLSHAALRSLGRVQTAVVNAECGAQHIRANLEPCVRLKFGCKCRGLGAFADLAHAIRGFAGEVNLGRKMSSSFAHARA